VPAVELLEPLRGRAVFVAFDCDDAGRTGAEKWATRLAGLGCRVHVVDLGLPDKGADVSDWFTQYGRGAGDLRALLNSTPQWTGEPRSRNGSRPSISSVGEPRNWTASAASGVVTCRYSTSTSPRSARVRASWRRPSATRQCGQPSKYRSVTLTGAAP
jgi:hypothetical protein